MRRELLKLANVVSVLACVTVLVLWALSYRSTRYSTLSHPHSYPADVPFDYDVLSVESSKGSLKLRRELVHHARYESHVPNSPPLATVRHWVLAAGAAAVPTASLVAWLYRRTWQGGGSRGRKGRDG